MSDLLKRKLREGVRLHAEMLIYQMGLLRDVWGTDAPANQIPAAIEDVREAVRMVDDLYDNEDEETTRSIERSRENYARVQQMILDDGGTWDLSVNDKDALRFVLGLVNLLADEVAKCDGSNLADVLDRFGSHVLSTLHECERVIE